MKKVKHYECVRQEGAKDCGVACLLTIVKTYHGTVSSEYVRTLTRTAKNGTNAYFLAEAGRKLGFEVLGVEADYHTLKKEQLPCIAHVIINKSYAHFVVIHAINKEKSYLTVADPSLGIRTIPFKEFDSIATGKYLFYELKKPFPLLNPRKRSIRKEISNTLFFYKHQGCICLFLSMFYILLQIITSFSFQIFIEKGITSFHSQNLFIFFYVFLIISFFKETFKYMRSTLLLYMTSHIEKNLFNKVITHLFSLSYLYFKNRTTGEVVARINDLKQLEEGLSYFLLSFVLDSFSFVFLFITLFLVSWPFALLLLGFLFLLFLLSLLENKIVKEKGTLYLQEGSRNASFLVEYIEGITSLQNVGLTSSFRTFLSYHHEKVINQKVDLQKGFLLFQFIRDFLKQGYLLVLLLEGGKKVLDGTLSFSKYFANYTLSGTLLSCFTSMLHFLEMYQLMHVEEGRINELLSYPIEEEGKIEDNFHQKWKKGIRLQNLSYSYLPKQPLIKDLSLFIPMGKRILLYGESGKGKSTLAKLLLRYLEVEPKTIYIDDKDITDYALTTLRNKIGYLSQEEMLFTDSLYQNVVLYEDYSYEDFLKIAKVTHLDFIKEKSTLGYYYLLEENGFNLSGGERQRVLLARTLLRKREIYILDESFSEIDVKTERSILKEMFLLYPDKTFLVISHRLSNQDLYQGKIHFTKEKTLCVMNP